MLEASRGITEGSWLQKSLSGWLAGQSFELLVGLKGALEGLSGPRSGKHSYLRPQKRSRRPAHKSKVGAGRVQGGCKEGARRVQGGCEEVRVGCERKFGSRKGP